MEPAELVFDLEDADGTNSLNNFTMASPDASLETLALRLELAARQPSELARKLRRDVLQLHAELGTSLSSETLLNITAAKLAGRGYDDVRIRVALGGGSECFRSLRHSFIVVRGTGEFEGMELIVELALRQHFAIPHPSPAYSAALALLPDVFVGAAFRLVPVVQTLCALMAASFESQGLTLPPWRREAAMLSKWLPTPSRLLDAKCFGPRSAWEPALAAAPPPGAAAAVAAATAAAAVVTGFHPPPPLAARAVGGDDSGCGSFEFCGASFMAGSSPACSEAFGACGASDLLSGDSGRGSSVASPTARRGSASLLIELGLGLAADGCGGCGCEECGGCPAAAAWEDEEEGLECCAAAASTALFGVGSAAAAAAAATAQSYRVTCTGMLPCLAAAAPSPRQRSACTGMLPAGGSAGGSRGSAAAAGTGLLAAHLLLDGLAARCVPPEAVAASATAAATAGSAAQLRTVPGGGAAAAASGGGGGGVERRPAAHPGAPAIHLVRMGWPAELRPAAAAAPPPWGQALHRQCAFPELAPVGGAAMPRTCAAAAAVAAVTAVGRVASAVTPEARSWLPWKLAQ